MSANPYREVAALGRAAWVKGGPEAAEVAIREYVEGGGFDTTNDRTRARRPVFLKQVLQWSDPATAAQTEAAPQLHVVKGRDRSAYTVAADSPAELKGSRADGIEALKQEWLWHGWIPNRALTIADGDMGIGKSQAMIDIAASLSRGGWWPDGQLGGPPASVLIVAIEDDPNTTIKPRLIAANADILRVHIIHSSEANALKVDRPQALERFIRDNEIRFVVFDAIMSHMPNDVNVNLDASVRQALMPLVEMAQRTNCAIVGVRHIGKAANDNAKHRGLNSVAFSAVARSVIYMAPEPAAPDNRTITVFALAKHNLTKPRPSLKFEVVPAMVGDDIPTSHVVWLGASHYTANMLSAARGEDLAGQASVLLLELFETEADLNGYLAVAKLEEAAKDRGFKPWAIKAARVKLRVKAEKSGLSNGWVIRLPKEGEE